MGWQKKILRVNLTEGTCISEPLDMGWANEYLGQRLSLIHISEPTRR